MGQEPTISGVELRFGAALGRRLLSASWRAFAWGGYALTGAVVLSLALARLIDVEVAAAMIAIGLAGLFLLVASALAAVRDDDADDAMPSWLMRLVFSFTFLSVATLSIIYLTSGSVLHLTAALAGICAAFAAGALLGFIFGVPRAMAGTGGGNGPDDERRYAPNTNLERISEWLTGIIIGLTLVQYTTIRAHFISSANEFATALGHEQIFVASALLLFFGISGFLLAYLWTRLRLVSDLSRADDSVRREPEYLEGMMNAYLYTSPPGGFVRAIAKGVEYRKRFRAPSSRVLLYLACAYGQQHRYLTTNREQGAEAALGVQVGEAKKLALDTIRECLEHDESLYKLLRSLWDPNDTQLADDDLESLYPDPDARRLFDEDYANLKEKLETQE